jgi:DMSO/TMAO reductase YedYZ molybdopterin-dependent catalytic subunit
MIPNRNWQAVLVLACIVTSVLAAGCTTAPAAGENAAAKDWRLVLHGTSEKVLTMDDLRLLPAVTGHGYAVSTTGVRFGPYVCTGVDLRDLADEVGGLGPGDRIWVSAPDGYMWVFDTEQAEGKGFVTFNESLKEIPSPPLRIILMYEQDGEPVSYDDGGPARIAIVSGQPGVVTEGSAWVKWVDRIEIKKS